MTGFVTGGRRVGSAAVRPLLSLLFWLGLIEEAPPTRRIRVIPALLQILGLIGWFGAGLTVSLGVTIALHSGPAFVEGRLGGFASESPKRVVELVENDWFADTGKAVTSLGIVYRAFSPAADTFTVRVEGYHLKLDHVALVCRDSTVVTFEPAEKTTAYIRQPPWPCSTLLVALTRTDNGDTIISTISLDGMPLPDRVAPDTLVARGQVRLSAAAA